jgi:hypothetical protein
MDKLLRRAREGATVNALAGEGRPQYRGKGIISRLRLLGTCSGDTLEAKELKTLLKQNGDAAAGPGRPRYRWSPESLALLTAEREKGLSLKEITGLINAKFDRDFTVGAICSKIDKLGLERPARIIVPKPPKLFSKVPVIKAPKLQPLTTALRFPAGSLLDRINAVVPRHLSRNHRDDVIGEMILAVYEGRLEEADIERCVRGFVNIGYRRDHDKYGPVSLDVPIFGDSSTTLGDMVTTGLWQ